MRYFKGTYRWCLCRDIPFGSTITLVQYWPLSDTPNAEGLIGHFNICVISFTPEMDSDKKVMGLPPVTSAVFLLAKSFW
jgi:hypothetical protein